MAVGVTPPAESEIPCGETQNSKCDNPKPKNGGRQCPASTQQTRVGDQCDSGYKCNAEGKCEEEKVICNANQCGCTNYLNRYCSTVTQNGQERDTVKYCYCRIEGDKCKQAWENETICDANESCANPKISNPFCDTAGNCPTLNVPAGGDCLPGETFTDAEDSDTHYKWFCGSTKCTKEKGCASHTDCGDSEYCSVCNIQGECSGRGSCESCKWGTKWCGDNAVKQACKTGMNIFGSGGTGRKRKSKSCSGDKPYCRDAYCTACRTNNDCSGSTPYCRGRWCNECTADSHCLKKSKVNKFCVKGSNGQRTCRSTRR